MRRINLVLLSALIAFSACKTPQTTTTSAHSVEQNAVSTKSMQGGMWIPSLLEGMNEHEMQILGSELSAQDIYDVSQPSLKDAIAHLGGYCTSEVISPQGLLLTNHHCAFGQIQAHSTLENDYIKDGFWAMTKGQELPNEGLYVDFIVSIEEVTEEVLDGVSDDMPPTERQSKIDINSDFLIKSAYTQEGQHAVVKPFYKGNRYFLFVKERYEDVRLVGAPPSSIGKFGSDTDNWMFPRHTGDFSLFRIYASPENRPAKYAEENIPFTPKHFLPISLDGVEEGDFTLVFGFPGKTDEYLPAVALELLTQKVNPSNIAIRQAALKVIDAEMKADDQVRIKYASKQARIANYWKKWIGENTGIEKSNAIANRQLLEEEFTQQLALKGLATAYGDLLPKFDTLFSEIEPLALKHSNFREVFARNIDLLKVMLRLYLFEQKLNVEKTDFEYSRTQLLRFVKHSLKDFDYDVDKGVFESVMPLYTDQVDASIYEKTHFADLEKAVLMLSGNKDQVLKTIQQDAAYQYAKPFIEAYYTHIAPEYQRLHLEIQAVQKQYMKAQMEVLPNKRYFPDANSTLRATYGQVKGYSPRDAVRYNYLSYLDGVVEKYIPNDYEFDVSQKLLELYREKNYGEYADANGKMPVCFLGTNHTTGGNSGSPAIDAHGNLVGLNFDRVWEGTMSDYNYDAALCRNIMVDIRYVLFIIDKYAEAKHLIEEMELVHPKN